MGQVIKSHAGLATERTLLEHSVLRASAGTRVILHDYKTNRVPARFALIGFRNTHHCVCRGNCVCVGIHLWEHTIHKRPISYISSILSRGDRVYSIELDYSGASGKCVYDVDFAAQGATAPDDTELTWRLELNGKLVWKLKGQGETSDLFYSHGAEDHTPLETGGCVYKETLEEVKHVKLTQYQSCVAQHDRIETGYDQIPITLGNWVLFWTAGTAGVSPYVLYRPKSLLHWIWSKISGVNMAPPRVFVDHKVYNQISALWSPTVTPVQMESAVRAYVRANPAVTSGQPADVWIAVVVSNLTYRNATLRESILRHGQTSVPGWWQVTLGGLSLLGLYEFLRHRLFSGRWIPRLGLGFSLSIKAPSLNFTVPEVSDEVFVPMINAVRNVKKKVQNIVRATQSALHPTSERPDQTVALIDQGWISYQAHEPFFPWKRVAFGVGVATLGLATIAGLAWSIKHSIEAEAEEERKLWEELNKDKNVVIADPKRNMPSRADPEKRGETQEEQKDRVQKSLQDEATSMDPNEKVVEAHSEVQTIDVPAIEVVPLTSAVPNPGPLFEKVVVSTSSSIAPEKLPEAATEVPKPAEIVPLAAIVNAEHAQLIETSVCVYPPQSVRDDVSVLYGVPKNGDQQGFFLSTGLSFLVPATSGGSIHDRQHAGRDYTRIVPTVFSNSYSNFVATLATRVLNERPQSQKAAWSILPPYYRVITKNIKVHPPTVQEWVESCNPSKRRHYARALQDLVEKIGPLPKVPANIAIKESRVDSFTKVELLACQHDLYSTAKPRNIMGASDVYQMFWGPYVRSIDAQLHAQFKMGSWAGPRKNLQWFKVSGVNVKELNELVRAALMSTQFVHSSQESSKYKEYIVMFACGDDNFSIICTKNGGVGFFICDFSKYDKTHSRDSWEHSYNVYRAWGIPVEDLKVWKKHSKVVKGAGVNQRSVKFSCDFNLKTGAPDTSLRNTFVGVLVGLGILDEACGHLLDYEKNRAKNSELLSTYYGNFGFEAKCLVTANLVEAEFLQGRFFLVGTVPYWVPKIGRALAKFGFKACWKSETKPTQVELDEAALIHLKSVALCYKDCYFPVLRDLAVGILGFTTQYSAEEDPAQAHKIKCTGYTVEENQRIYDSLLVPISEFYNVPFDHLTHFCNQLRNLTCRCAITHPVFTAMLERDVPDWFTK